MACLCEKCPVQAYDCFFAGDTVATQCQAVVACALQTACTTLTDCLAKCGSVITAASPSALVAAQALQSCSVACLP
jgi:hypothetical protein